MFSFCKKKAPATVPTGIVVLRIKLTNFLIAVDAIPGMPAGSKPIA
jgi:hypothetical protein